MLDKNKSYLLNPKYDKAKDHFGSMQLKDLKLRDPKGSGSKKSKGLHLM